MIEYRDTLNFCMNKENYIAELREILIRKYEAQIIVKNKEDDKCILLSYIQRKINEKYINVEIEAVYDKSMLYEIGIKFCPEEGDQTNYEMELKLFYFQEIKGEILNSLNGRKDKYTIRNYRAIYNSTPIRGGCQINGEHKFSFHTLYELERDEPLTEHIICFDIEVEEKNIERARAKAYNITSDYSSFLSVLLDIGFYDIQSKFVNIVHTKLHGTRKVLLTERYRTAFFDEDMDLVIMDNLNGVCTKENVEKGIGGSGYVSFYLGNQVNHMKYGDIDSVNARFEKHRLYKAKFSNCERRDGIQSEVHYPGEEILIPKNIRDFFRGIETLRKENKTKYNSFRNAARLYNKSHFMGMNEASIEIAFLVACVEALGKGEKKGFSDFVEAYCDDVDKKEIDLIYSVRSKLLHAGEFSFFEYDLEMNPFTDPLYLEFARYYMRFKQIVRDVVLSWVYTNILKAE